MFLQTLLKTFFLWPLFWWNWNSKWTNCQTKYRTISDVSYGFGWNASSHANKMFLNGNEIADEILPNIQFSLTPVRDASLPGIQTYFIYSSRIIGKLSLISIKKYRVRRSSFTMLQQLDSLHVNLILWNAILILWNKTWFFKMRTWFFET